VAAAPTELDERRALIDAGIAVLRRTGSEGCTVADVLEEAGLSTRAFYRHFASKDELVLAIYEHDARPHRHGCVSA
jgi:AcrR family transcriptional regulator